MKEGQGGGQDLRGSWKEGGRGKAEACRRKWQIVVRQVREKDGRKCKK